MTLIKNTNPGRRFLAGRGIIEGGATVDVTPEEAKAVLGEGGGFIVVAQPRRAEDQPEQPPRDPAQAGGEQTGDKPSHLDELLAEYAGEEEFITRDRAEDIAGTEGVSDRAFADALRGGEIVGAHKEGEAANSPWKIPTAGLCQWIVTFLASQVGSAE